MKKVSQTITKPQNESKTLSVAETFKGNILLLFFNTRTIFKYGNILTKLWKIKMKLWKITNFDDDLYLFYDYKKWTNFQSPLIITCRWILGLRFSFNISRNFRTEKGLYCIIEVLHHCRIRKFRFQNGNLVAALETACLYLIEMFKNTQNIHWEVFSKAVVLTCNQNHWPQFSNKWFHMRPSKQLVKSAILNFWQLFFWKTHKR